MSIIFNMENFNQYNDLYVKIFTELKTLGVKVPKLKKSKCKREVSTLEESCKIFGVNLSDQEWVSDGDYPIPKFIALVIAYLQKYVDKEVGLFRKAGNFQRQKRLREEIERGKDIESSDPNDVASILKKWLRELPEPVIPSYLQDLFIRCQNLESEKNRISACLLACLLLPIDHLNTLKYLLRFFAAVALSSEKNKMGTYNLAVILAPNIFASREPIQKAKNSLIFQHTTVIKILLENFDKIGELPPSISLQSSLHVTDSRYSIDESEMNTSKFKKKMSGVQDIFRKLVRQSGADTPKNMNADEVFISTPRQAISLDDLDASFATAQTKAPEKKSSVHARRKSFGALFLRKKDKKKFNKNNLQIEQISLSLETISPKDIGKLPTTEDTKSEFNYNLRKSFSVKEKSKSKITEVFPPTSKPLSIAPICSDSFDVIRNERSTKWHVGSITKNTDPFHFKSQDSNIKAPAEMAMSSKFGLSRQEAFIFKPNKVKPLNPATEVKKIDNSETKSVETKFIETQNNLCQHSESFCTDKCDKNKSTVIKELLQENKCTVAEKKFSLKKSEHANPEKEISQLKYRRTVSEQKMYHGKSKQTLSSRRPSSLKLNRKSEIHSQKELSHTLKKSSSTTVAGSSLSKSCRSNQKAEEPMPEKNSSQNLDLSLSLLLHNFCLSPPKESPELRVSIDITSTNSANSELRVSLRNKSPKDTAEKQRFSERLQKISENEPSESKPRNRLSSSSDSRIPRLKRCLDPQRPSSFSGRLSEFKSAHKRIDGREKSPKTYTSKIPTYLVENYSPKVVKEEQNTNDSVYLTPNSSFFNDASISWMSGSMYLSALSTPDKSMTNKRESIAKILKYNEGHVKAKASMFDQPCISNLSIDKLSDGKLVRASSEKCSSGIRLNREKLAISNSCDSVSKKDISRFRTNIQKSNFQNPSKTHSATQDAQTLKRSSSLDRSKINFTLSEKSNPKFHCPK